MQLLKWSKVNRRYFAAQDGLSQAEWRDLIRQQVINGKILGPHTYIDIDQLAANSELTGTPVDDIPDLLA